MIREETKQLIKINKKIKRTKIATITAFAVFVTTLTLGIIFLLINTKYNDILSIIYFSVAGVTLLPAIFLDYHYRSLLKYRNISLGANPKNENYKPLKDQPRDKKEVLEENQPGNFGKNVKKTLDKSPIFLD